MPTATAFAALLAIFAGLASADTEFAEMYSEHLKEVFDESNRNDSHNLYFEWEGYDGWYNNPAHPDWGGAGIIKLLLLPGAHEPAKGNLLYITYINYSLRLILCVLPDMPLERKTPVAYPDGVYEIAGKDRPNVLLIANITQNGLTGFGSRERTALFIFFGECIIIMLLQLAIAETSEQMQLS